MNQEGIFGNGTHVIEDKRNEEGQDNTTELVDVVSIRMCDAYITRFVNQQTELWKQYSKMMMYQLKNYRKLWKNSKLS